MTSPADEEDQDVPAAEREASVEGNDAGGEDEQDDLAAEWETMVGEGEGAVALLARGPDKFLDGGGALEQ